MFVETPFIGPVSQAAPLPLSQGVAQGVAAKAVISAKSWSEWQDLNLRPPRPERGVGPLKFFAGRSGATVHFHLSQNGK